MCNLVSNAMFDTFCLVGPTLPGMHPSMERLYSAAEELGKVTGQSNVARKLIESPQTVKNWETRGISDAGAIKAEGILGCRAHWLTTGEGDMLAGSTINQPCSVQTPTPTQIANALLSVPDASLAELVQVVALLRSTGSDAYRQRLAELLSVPAQAAVSVSPLKDAA